MTFQFTMQQTDGHNPTGTFEVSGIQNEDKTVTITMVEFQPVQGAKQWLHMAMLDSLDCRELQQRIYDAAHNHLSGDNVLDTTTDILNEHIAQMKGGLE